MTAVNSSASAMQANPLASLLGRVKPIDQNELIQVANQVAQEQAAMQSSGGIAAGSSTGAAGATGTAGANDSADSIEAQIAQAKQEQAELLAQLDGSSASPTTSTTTGAAATPTTTTTTTPTTTASPTTSTTTAVPDTTTSVVGADQAVSLGAAAGGAATTQSTGVNVPSSQIAPRTTGDYWSKHIAQYSGKYLPDGPTMAPNCGPASTTMALRMIGLDIPGFSGQNSEKVLDQARIIATGKNDTSVGTTDGELENLITKSGAKWSESNNMSEIEGWVKQGIPVVLSGNPAKGWDSRYNNNDVQHFDGGHWVTVSGYDEKTGYFIVNDPLSQIGPIYVSKQELESYNQAHGQLGIAVFR